MVDPVEVFLSTYPEDVQRISRELRTMARRAMHGAHEFLYYDAINYSLSNSPIDRICYIRPLKNRVTLGFRFGRQLDDPHHVLEGVGKRMRHVKLKAVEDTRNPALKELVKSAWDGSVNAIAQMRRQVKRQRMRLRIRYRMKHRRARTRKRVFPHQSRSK